MIFNIYIILLLLLRKNISLEMTKQNSLIYYTHDFQGVRWTRDQPMPGSFLFGIRLLILHIKFQFSKSIKSSTFHILLNLIYPLRKNISFPKCPKITQKCTQNHQTERFSVVCNVAEILERLSLTFTANGKRQK